MAGKKPSRSEIDRFSGHAITSVSITPQQKKAIAEYNAQQAKKAAKPTTRTKKK